MADDADQTAADAADEGEEAPAVELFHGVPVSDSRGQVVLHPDRDTYVELITTLADEGYRMCVDLCGVDALTNTTRQLPVTVEPQRFEVVVNLLDLDGRRRIRVRVQIPEDDPTLPSITALHPGAEAMEREAMDMFGVTFDDHPDPTRILLPEDWDGHPLRKDYAMGRIPVQFKAVEGR
ncbi:MAG: NADH-quinone oxidoreductase subunit C [Actinomycetota bacterium]|jgi:NADH-quinone oxidoreductase subunit C|nr:NADH-quinone oxidoreductase subunit C [Actinomycetota bacterium]